MTRRHGPEHTLSAILRKMATREKGFATADVLNFTTRQVSNAATHLRKHGELFGAKIAHNTYRWFDTDERAKAYEARHKQSYAPNTQKRSNPGDKAQWQPPKMTATPSHKSGKAWWPKDAPEYRPAHVQVTICPCRIGERYQTQTHEDHTL